MSQDTFSTGTGSISVTTGDLINNSSSSAHNSSNHHSEAQAMLDAFWPKVVEDIKNLTTNDFKNQELPLARIKKIMKLDDDVKVMMISAEAPVLFAKAAEIFITETSLRAWIHTEDNKRRTLQRNDIAMAITKNDQFDFLIDIVPRDEVKPTKRTQQNSNVSVGGVSIDANAITPDQLQNLCYTLAQQPAGLAQATQAGQQIQILQTTPTLQAGAPGQTFTLPQLVHVQVPNTQNANSGDITANNGQHSPVAQSQVFHIAGQPGTTTTTAATTQPQNSPGQIQILQQVIANGEIVQQQIPIQLTQAQLNLIRLQSQVPTNQPIIIQASPINQGAATTQYQLTAGQPFLTQTVVTSSATAGASVDAGNQLDDDEHS